MNGQSCGIITGCSKLYIMPWTQIRVASKDCMALSSEKPVVAGFQLQQNIVCAGNGLGFKNMLRAGQQWLEAHVNVVNGLNVFPVPDGDTGTNMWLTIDSAVREAEGTPDEGAGAVAAAAAYGALMGARGNSGVILSQFLEGLASGLAGQDSFTSADLARAAGIGVKKAYGSVAKPVEGTMLTVARRIAEAAEANAANVDLVALLGYMVEAGRAAQAQTPELLPVLKQAGVTDSGGLGLLYILEGAYRLLCGWPTEADPTAQVVPVLRSSLGAGDGAYGYDVQFLIRGDRLDVETIRTQVGDMGWSTMAVGDEHLVRVHVHTTDPGKPISYGAGLGALSDVVVENMEAQARQFIRSHMPPAADKPGQGATHTAVISVAPGRGLAEIFRSLGASEVLFGGESTPVTQDLLEAVNRLEADSVLILPNNSNVILAAQQVQNLASKNVGVVATKTIPQGIAALLSFNYQADLETNVRLLVEAAQKVDTVEIMNSIRDTYVSGLSIARGDIIGLLNETPVSVGRDSDQVALDVLSRLAQNGAGPALRPDHLSPDFTGLARKYELITIYFGQDRTQEQARRLADKISDVCPEIPVEIYEGGQLFYPYIISLE